MYSFTKPWPKYSGWKPEYPCTHCLECDSAREEEHCVGCEASVVVFWQRKWGIWADINSPIKNRRTQTNKVAANWRGKEEGGGGDTVQKWNVFMFSCPTNGSYFPPLCIIWDDIAHDTVGAVKRTFDERFPWWAVCAVTPSDFLQQPRHGLCLYRDEWQHTCDEIFEVGFNSYMRLLLVFYKIS